VHAEMSEQAEASALAPSYGVSPPGTNITKVLSAWRHGRKKG
jgi:hypothetical protein